MHWPLAALVWNSSTRCGFAPHRLCPGGRIVDIPNKTPLTFGQLSGSSSSFRMQDLHVFLINFGSSALFWNLESSVSARSVVSLLLSALAHLLQITVSEVPHSVGSSSLILLSFLIFHRRYAVSDARILYSS